MELNIVELARPVFDDYRVWMSSNALRHEAMSYTLHTIRYSEIRYTIISTIHRTCNSLI